MNILDSASEPISTIAGLGAIFTLGVLGLGFAWGALRAPSMVRTLSIVAYLGHVVAGIVLLEVFGLDASDAGGYHQTATQLAAYMTGDVSSGPVVTSGKEGWVWLLGVTYAFMGPVEVVGVFYNAFFLALIPVCMYQLTNEIASPRAGRVCALMSFFVPSYWYWGSMPLREALVSLLVALLILFATRAARHGKFSTWFCVALTLALLVFVRGGTAVLLAAAIIAAMVLSSARGRTAKGRWPLLIFGGTAVAGLAAVAFQAVAREVSFERISATRTAQSADAATTFQVSGYVDSWASLVVNGARVFPRVLIGPFPWEIQGAIIPLVPFAVFWWLVLFLSVGGLMSRRVGGFWPFLILPTFALLIALAVYSGNYGTMVRLRDQALPMLLPLAAVGLQRFSRPRLALPATAVALRATRTRPQR